MIGITPEWVIGITGMRNLYRQRDILAPDAVLYLVHLEDDPRGFVRMHERHRVREVAVERIRTHPFR